MKSIQDKRKLTEGEIVKIEIMLRQHPTLSRPAWKVDETMARIRKENERL